MRRIKVVYWIRPQCCWQYPDSDKITEGVKLDVQIGPDIKNVRFFKKFNLWAKLHIFVYRLLYDYVVVDYEDSEVWKAI